jgi:polysaccharide export outer membrane protein
MRQLISIVLILVAFAPLSSAQSESLLIGPGDLVDINVFDTPEMAQELRVSDAGTVRLQLIGDVKLAGETPAAAAKIVEDALVGKKIMHAPQVIVKVVEYATQDVSILGQVRNPGTYPVTTPQTVLRVVAMAGGLTDVADRNIMIERHRDPSEKIKYYLANDAQEVLSASPIVYPGDTVVVPRAPVVYVLGDVAKPGGYSIATNDSRLTVLQVIGMAGSANKTAVQSHVRLIRKTPQGEQEISIQLAAIQKGKQPDVVLQPNDVLYIPFSWMKNTALSASSIAASTSGAAIYAVH